MKEFKLVVPSTDRSVQLNGRTIYYYSIGNENNYSVVFPYDAEYLNLPHGNIVFRSITDDYSGRATDGSSYHATIRLND
ncbi:hypothetical protein [Fructilactobacillus fructivorans]|uniref:hypothetical protein n=1 Tax=Fructilactobacillus fructivorans TaxID=1614 RepID=UPI00057F3655|nr:hypothetical protein [Fructilactobacillus fructivorans]MCT0151966.1 hypothetical protein [Fructilactobacillus fructivorans]MCT2867858.1 hypothetical protein [Fructilactobacillus fructivorans]MCT2868560.1 hypothetical protein [Fructilactobacillus fructivorans]MCT2873560.1 hypothetical protein [Fructilactobacillus fructivorans]